MANYSIRNTIRVILLNSRYELLLMCIDDPQTKAIDEKIGKRFWVSIGGAIEGQETIIEAAKRELFEEAGFVETDVTFGPIVWRREVDIVLYGKRCHINEKYIVAKTKKSKVAITQLTSYEVNIVKHLSWFSLDQIKNSQETIYPELLVHYLPDIIAGRYPPEPIDITKNW